MQVFPQKGTGSGFIINPDGQILTNNHVVQGATQLTVKLADQKEYKAKVLGNNRYCSWGQSFYSASRKGKIAVIIGMDGLVTTGIINSISRCRCCKCDN